MGTFQKIVGSFITTVDTVAAEVEKEKIKVSHALYDRLELVGTCMFKDIP